MHLRRNTQNLIYWKYLYYPDLIFYNFLKNTNLCIIAHDQVSELNNLVVDGGPVPLLDDVVGCPPLTLLHYPSWPDSSRHHLGLVHVWSGCAWARAWLYLFDWQLVSSSHHNREGGQDVAAHKRLQMQTSRSTFVLHLNYDHYFHLNTAYRDLKSCVLDGRGQCGDACGALHGRQHLCPIWFKCCENQGVCLKNLRLLNKNLKEKCPKAEARLLCLFHNQYETKCFVASPFGSDFFLGQLCWNIQIETYYTHQILLSTLVTYRYLLHLLLHSVDCSGRWDSLDGLTCWGQNTLVLNGHWLELRWRHDALHLWLEDWRDEREKRSK